MCVAAVLCGLRPPSAQVRGRAACHMLMRGISTLLLVFKLSHVDEVARSIGMEIAPEMQERFETRDSFSMLYLFSERQQAKLHLLFIQSSPPKLTPSKTLFLSATLRFC